MENAVEALKMAFAVLVFIMALSVSIFAFNSAKAASDLALYTEDETNFYDYQGATGKGAENRIVGLETIIPTLYKYYKENYTVVFRTGNYDTLTGNFSNVSYLNIYETPSRYKTNAGALLWGSNKKDESGNTYNTYDKLMQEKYSIFIDGGYTKEGSTDIFAFDLDEETLRHEPWTGSNDKIKDNLDKFLNGGIYYNPNLYNPNKSEKDNKTAIYIDYSKQTNLGIGGFIEKYKNKKFIETIGEYTYNKSSDSQADQNGTTSSLTKDKKKRIIIFTLMK